MANTNGKLPLPDATQPGDEKDPRLAETEIVDQSASGASDPASAAQDAPQATTAAAASSATLNGSPVPPRAPGSGFRRQRMAPEGELQTEETRVRDAEQDTRSVYRPGQALSDPGAHPKHPDVIVNEPYGDLPKVLNTATGQHGTIALAPDTTLDKEAAIEAE